jgi:hypothetical protein
MLALNYNTVIDAYQFRHYNYDIEDMKNIAENHRGKCLSKEYLGARKHLLWECSSGHRWEATPNNVKNKGT